MPTNFDNTRIFELPDITAYSEEQLDVEYLSPEGKHLIIGGPGTGKSVLALSRARLLAKKQARDSKLDYKFVVYNKMLSYASKQLYPDVVNITWIRWFNKLLTENFGVHPDKYEQKKMVSFFNSHTGENKAIEKKIIGSYFWEEIEKLIYFRHAIKSNPNINIGPSFNFKDFFYKSKHLSSKDDHELINIYNDILSGTAKTSGVADVKLTENIFKRIVQSIINNDDLMPLINTYLIIDEGQDMPKGFYHFLMGLGCNNIFIAADQNQQITNSNSNISELEDVIDSKVSKELTENFRQANGGYYVALLAEQFHCDEATPKTKLPNKSGSIEAPLLFDYDQQKRPFNKICQQIVTSCLLMPNKLIGIITPDNQVRLKYFNILNEIIQEEQNEILLTTYFSKKNIKHMANMHFNKGGIMVINAASCKGLEFDRVYIADINKFQVEENSDVTKKLFYVMTSRAREKVIMLRDINDNSCPVIDYKILPTDDNILKRYPLPE